ncbi:MAG TPA: 16S rRNA (guanine(966)-N(2))-methyltransferase RsmD [Paracoccaceae bacterium]|nr:16S rRNA (guanine(966)-N(2))-methyltransferase RsmD [Paracoccaceae bacterium]
MRIIGGRFRGSHLATPGKAAEGQLRPTSDRVREAVFNLLAHGNYGQPSPPENRRVLDLFAGTGALGIEALSRGASFTVFVEDHPASRALIRENVERLRLTGETKIWRRDATRLGPCRSAPFDLIFADPPYGRDLGGKALASARAGGWIAPGAIIVLEFGRDEAAPELPGLCLVEDRHYGDSRILILVDGSQHRSAGNGQAED